MSSQTRRQRSALAILTGLALVVLVSIVLMLMHGLRQQAEDSARTEFENLTRVFQEHVWRVISLTDKSMRAFRNAYVEDGPLFSLPTWVANNTVATDMLPQIGVIGADGILLMSTGTATDAATTRIDLSDREHFRVHVVADHDFLFVSKPVLGRASGHWTIQLTRSIRRPDGAIEAVVVFSIATEYLSQFYQSIDIGKSGTIMLVGSDDGIVRAVGKSGETGPNLGDDLSGRQLLREAAARPAGSFIVHNDGVEALCSYRRLPNLPLIVAVGAEAGDYLAPYNSKRLFITAFAVVAALTILIMAGWLDMQLAKQARVEEKATLAQLAAADAEAVARVRAEEDQRYRAATDSASDAIVSWRLGGELLFANPSARAIFALQDRVEVADVYAVLFPPDEADRVRSLVHNLRRRSRRGMTLEVNALSASGEVFTAEISLSLWRSQGGQSATMVARDVSLRRAAEEERKELMTQAMTAQKMEAIGTLAGGIAHDFNNVLGAMLGFIWLAQQQCEPKGKIAVLLEKASASGDRAALVVRQLLDFSRANRAEMGLVGLAECIHDLQNLTSASIPTTISCHFVVIGAPKVVGNATQIQQGLLNLVINASHAIGDDQDGRIDVFVEESHIRDGWFGGRAVADTDTLPLVKSIWKSDGAGGKLWYGNLPPGRYVSLVVHDNGPGMSADVLRRIFEPFFTTKKVGEGTGLGLPALLGVVRAMQGGIVVSSVVGSGTSFEVLLPLAESEAERTTTVAGTKHVGIAEAIPTTFDEKTILVVDDEESLRRVAKDTLEAGGFRVVLATDGVDALEKFDGNPAVWSLVLTDWTMPRMSGERLIAELHDRNPDLAILVCTGRADRLDELHRLPVRAVLSKPVYGAELIRAVTSALD